MNRIPRHPEIHEEAARVLETATYSSETQFEFAKCSHSGVNEQMACPDTEWVRENMQLFTRSYNHCLPSDGYSQLSRLSNFI